MGKYDAIVVGAGISGLVAAAVLAHQGKKPLLIEKSDRPGGRTAVWQHEGYKLQMGAHLSEDSGSGTTKIMEFLGSSFDVGPTNDNMPVYHEGKWMAMHEVIGADKEELKKVINALMETPYEEFDRYLDKPLRDWILEKTSSESVVKLFEFLSMVEGATTEWWDHSASENLFVRKMHYEEKKTAGYSFWPKFGWDGFFADLERIITSHGGEISYNTKVTKIVVEEGQVQGVKVERGGKATPNEYIPSEFIPAPAVICTIPVWHVLDVLPQDKIPSWYLDKIRLVAKDEHKAIYLGLYIALDEPIYNLSKGELAAWFKGPKTGLPGWGFLNSALDTTVAPPGKHLWVCGCYVNYKVPQDRDLLERTFQEFEQDLEIMYPAFKNCLWKKRHVVFRDPYVANKPGIMGASRPGNEVPGALGLYFGGDSFQGVTIGTDRAARQGLSAAERVLGARIPAFEAMMRV